MAAAPLSPDRPPLRRSTAMASLQRYLPLSPPPAAEAAKPRPYKTVHAIGDIHSDSAVLLSALRHIGLDFNPEASEVSNLINWSDKTQDTVVVLCGDIVDRRRGGYEEGKFVDNQHDRLLFSAQHNKYFVVPGTDGEQPLEEEIIFIILTHLHQTANAANRNNRIVLAVGNHDVFLLVSGRTLLDYTTDLALFSELEVNHDVVARDELCELARLRWSEFQRLTVDAQAEIFAGAQRVVFNQTERSMRVGGAPRIVRRHLRRVVADTRPFLYAFWSIGPVLFSHAGFTAESRRLWRHYGVINPTFMVRELASNAWTLQSVARLLTNQSEQSAQALLQALAADSQNPFWLRVTAADFGEPITDLQELGVQQSIPILVNVLGHNCGKEDLFPDAARNNVVMLDYCASRGMYDTVEFPNGPIRILTMDVAADPDTGNYDVLNFTDTRLPAIESLARPMPLLREQMGVVVVADFFSGEWVVRPPPFVVQGSQGVDAVDIVANIEGAAIDRLRQEQHEAVPEEERKGEPLSEADGRRTFMVYQRGVGPAR